MARPRRRCSSSSSAACRRARLPGCGGPRAGARLLENLRFSRRISIGWPDRPVYQAPPRLPRRAALHRRRPCRPGGDALLRQRADPGGHGAAYRGPIRRDAAHQRPPFPDADRLQGGAHGARRARPLLIDFGLRRAHGAEAGLLAARAAYLAGFAGTATSWPSSCSASRSPAPWRIPSSRLFDDEARPSSLRARSHRTSVTLLLDTYDTQAAARQVVALAPRLQATRHRLRAVRLDSGDLAGLSRAVRAHPRRGRARRRWRIFASGGLDEDALAAFVARRRADRRLRRRHPPDTSADAPALDCAYKLEDYAGLTRRKFTPGKATWPGRKQVWRRHAADGSIAGDVISTAADEQPGTPLIAARHGGGRRLAPRRGFRDRSRAASALRHLPEPLRHLEPGKAYPVQIGRRWWRSPPRPTGGLRRQGRRGVSERIMPTARRRALVVDVQNDFCPGGSARGAARRRGRADRSTGSRENFRHVVLTQDWHPRRTPLLRLDASGAQAFRHDRAPLRAAGAVAGPLRPGHARRRVPQRSRHSPCAADHAQGLSTRTSTPTRRSSRTITRPPTGLVGYLRERGLTRVVLAGLAFDFCVRYSAEDAFAKGLR